MRQHLSDYVHHSNPLSPFLQFPLRGRMPHSNHYFISANSLAYIVIFGLGLAPALLLWSTTNILTGWSTGRFGLFGLKQKIPEHEMLNIVGLITIIIG
ncbi:unnamed protein product [Meloidogyne enterolobii]|uniref:Uncharacterized protein n=1 Tax=Meloidogyne enterolobii TaxID=390850 RepID=A0ACB1ATA3_MELEN